MNGLLRLIDRRKQQSRRRKNKTKQRQSHRERQKEEVTSTELPEGGNTISTKEPPGIPTEGPDYLARKGAERMSEERVNHWLRGGGRLQLSEFNLWRYNENHYVRPIYDLLRSRPSCTHVNQLSRR